MEKPLYHFDGIATPIVGMAATGQNGQDGDNINYSRLGGTTQNIKSGGSEVYFQIKSTPGGSTYNNGVTPVSSGIGTGGGGAPGQNAGSYRWRYGAPGMDGLAIIYLKA